MALTNTHGDGDIPFKRSIRGKLTVIVITILMLTVTCVTVFDFIYIRDILKQEIRNELSLYGESLRSILHLYVEQELELLRTYIAVNQLDLYLELASGSTAGANELNERLRTHLDEFETETGTFRDFQLLDREGTIVAASTQPQVGQSLAGSSLFEKGRLGKYAEFWMHDTLGQCLAMSEPIANPQGELLGVAIINCDASLLQEVLNSAQTAHESIEVRLGVLNEQDMIEYVFTTDDSPIHTTIAQENDSAMSRALQGETDFIDNLVDADGSRVLTVFLPVSYGSFGLVVQVSTNEVFAPTRRALATTIIVGTTVALLSILVATTFVRTSLFPIRRLARAAQRVTDGDLTVTVSDESKDELGALARVFDHMVETVRTNQQTLEDTVNRRTAELEESKDQLSALVASFERQNELMDQDLQQAEVIQRSLLPRHPPKVPGYTLSALYVPGNNVGGDLYDVFRIDDQHYGLVVADATGHGVSAAMLSVLFKNRLDLVEADESVFQSDSASDRSTDPVLASHSSYSAIPVFERVNEELVSDVVGSNMFVTAVCCILDTQQSKLTITNAGHPPVLYIRASGEVELIKTPGPALGLYPDAVFAERTLTLSEGDNILLYTDGLFSLDEDEAIRMEAIASKLQVLKGQDNILNALVSELQNGATTAEQDDITMLMIDVREGENQFENQFESLTDNRIASSRAGKENNGQPAPHIEIAQDETTTYLIFVGKVTWIQGKPVAQSIRDAVRKKRNIVVDLNACDYLDSAMLGTLHEMAHECTHNSLKLTIQGSSKPIYDAFVELGMYDVLGFVITGRVSLPTNRSRLSDEDMDMMAQQRWLLRVHEALASLNTANEDEFRHVIDELREGIDEAEQARDVKPSEAP